MAPRRQGKKFVLRLPAQSKTCVEETDRLCVCVFVCVYVCVCVSEIV